MNRTALSLIALFSAGCLSSAPMASDAMMPADEPVAYRSAETAEQDGASDDVSQATERKVIRTGSVSIEIDHYGPFEDELSDWLLAHGGQITSENLSHSAGEVGWSSLTLRVPADDLDPLTSWLEETVEVTNLSIHSEDVTRTWVDLSARLDNARHTEARLLGLLEAEAESLTDVLAVERELSRVRGDVESMEAQKRSLDGQIAMSTLSLSVTVQAPYESTVSASFRDRITAAFTGSLETMGETGEAALLAGVAAAPWLMVLGGGLWGISSLRRRRVAA